MQPVNSCKHLSSRFDSGVSSSLPGTYSVAVTKHGQGQQDRQVSHVGLIFLPMQMDKNSEKTAGRKVCLRARLGVLTVGSRASIEK